MKLVKTISVLTLLAVILRFVTLLETISFDFGFLSYLGRYLPSWIFGLVGIGVEFALYKATDYYDGWKTYALVSLLFCAFVVLLELAMFYVLSRI